VSTPAPRGARARISQARPKTARSPRVPSVVLRGLTWRHTRGWLPLVAASAALEERTEGRLRVEWEQRSLWEFGEGDLTGPARAYDLLVLDHPLIGEAVAADALCPLDEDASVHDPADDLGGSQASYMWQGRTWALAVDAACQVASWRPDLLEASGAQVPTTLDEVLALARVAPIGMAMAPVDLWCTWLSLCAGLGQTPFAVPGELVGFEVGREAVALLATLVDAAGPRWLGRNPVAVLSRLATHEDVVYVPYAFGYSNYARQGYALSTIASGPSPVVRSSRSTSLGGAGVAVSAFGAHQDQALQAAEWFTSAPCQAGPYLEAGGQPARRSAWECATASVVAGDYFRQTLPALEAAFPRPCLPGMREFQTEAGDLLLQHATSRTLDGALTSTLLRRWDAFATTHG